MQNPIINSRYRILQQIGVGGFSLTYLAEDIQLAIRPKTVVKHLKPQITDDESVNLANRLFQQEAKILYRLGGHPNIPSLIAHFKERGEFFLVQEFIEGHTLDREFQGGRKYNQKEIIQFLGQTLEILSFVHSQKVIHRDIKPANLIRRISDGNIFLIDFGAVRQVGAAPRKTDSSEAFVAVGSHGYMPVEQMAGNPNFGSDLYALGLVAVEALTGVKPFELPKDSSGEFSWAHKTQLSPDLERFITKLVRQDFRQRFVSANEALAAFDVIASNIGFFNSRPQTANMMTVQPITANQTFQQPALPITNPSFVPPTVIVPANGASGANYPYPFQHAAPPKKSSGLTAFLTVFGILGFIGFLCVAGKILNFRWSSLNDPYEDRTESSRQMPVSPSNGSTTMSLFDEAMKQAREAAEIESKATTRFEWEQVSNKYKRASALLASIEPNNPNYADAQEKSKVYFEMSETAAKKAGTMRTTNTINSSPNRKF